jgi:hypothetical protein
MEITKYQEECIKAAKLRLKSELLELGIKAPEKHLHALALADQLKVFYTLFELHLDIDGKFPFTYEEYFEKLKFYFPVKS